MKRSVRQRLERRKRKIEKRLGLLVGGTGARARDPRSHVSGRATRCPSARAAQFNWRFTSTRAAGNTCACSHGRSVGATFELQTYELSDWPAMRSLTERVRRADDKRQSVI